MPIGRLVDSWHAGKLKGSPRLGAALTLAVHSAILKAQGNEGPTLPTAVSHHFQTGGARSEAV